MKKNVAGQVIGAQIVSASDGSAFTGAVIVYVTGDGGTQAVGSVSSGACAHKGNGYHTYVPAQAETNYDQVAFTFTGTGAVPVTIQVYTNFPQTGDSFARIGSPAGASVSADLADLNNISTSDVNTEIANAIVTYRLDHLVYSAVTGADVTDNSIVAKLVSKSATADWDSYNNTTDAAEAIRDRGDSSWTGGGSSPQLLQSTTIATLASQTSFTLTAGSADDDAYNNALAIITDQSTSAQKAVGFISDYTGSSKTVTLLSDPGIFTMAVGDSIDIVVGVNQKFPNNFKDMAVAIGTGWVTVGTNQDKTDYEILGTKKTLDDLNDIAATAIVSNGAITTLSGAVVNVDTVDTCTTNTDMVSAPPSAASIADAVWDESQSGHTIVGTFGKFLDSEVSTAGGGGLTEAGIADAVWDEAIAGHLSSGSMGEALNAAGSAGDPWVTALPGAYSAGQAGYIIGTNINATVSSRASQTSLDTVDGIVDSILSAIDTEIAAIKAKTDQLTFTDTNKIDATIQAAADIKAAVANKLADHAIRRSLASALASSDGDTKSFRSLAGSIAKQVNRVALSGSTLTTYETDDSTALGTQTATTSSSASPVTGLDTD